MRATARDAIAWLHTWTGLLLGTLLFAIFWMGTLSVFDREIDRWMMPVTRVEPPPTVFSADAAWARTRDAAIGSPLWVLNFPSDREPTARIQFADSGSAARAAKIDGSRKGIPLSRERLRFIHADPNTGDILPDPGSKGASGFFFPFHWHMLLGHGSVGQWIVGLAGLAMLVSIISGVIIHRELFAQFFTFRRRRSGRMLLDLHNASAVLALPFHAFITFSGLAIFYFLYFPAPLELTHPGGERQLFEESRSDYSRLRADAPGSLASLDAMVRDAQTLWGGGAPARLVITFPGDANAYVHVARNVEDLVPYDDRPVYFDAQTGQVLKFAGIRPIPTAQRYIAGLHFIAFHHWLLRWLYFLLGLVGCALIATGAMFWLQKRRKLHRNDASVALVEALTIGSTTGIVAASAGFLVANRLLPMEVAGRAGWEVTIFFAAWGAMFVHAAIRRGEAWREQCWIIAGTAVLAVVLNAATTGSNPVKELMSGSWAVAGTDLVLLLGAGLAVAAARRLGQGARSSPASPRVLPADG